MTENQEKILLNMTYFCVISLSIVSSVFFIYRVVYSNFLNYVKIIYYVIIGLLFLNLIYDVICTLRHSSKFIVGLILFSITIASIIMSLYILIMEGLTFKVISEVEIRFFINTLLSFAPVFLAIFAFIIGERIINID